MPFRDLVHDCVLLNAPQRRTARRISASGRFVLIDRIRDTLMLFTRFGGDLLSHVLRRSTIGATVLNGRVRDGIVCFTCAMTTKPRKQHHCPSKKDLIPSFIRCYVYALDLSGKA